MKRCYWLLSLLLPLMVGCEHLPTSHGTQSENVVDSFCQAYFGYHYERAMRFTTEESHKWLVYAASNVEQEDIDALHAQENGATITVDEIVTPEKDSIGYAIVRVDNHLVMDTIGQVGHIHDATQYRLEMVKRGGKWKIKLDGLPRGEE